jgi:hypothetical protein
MSSKLKEKEKEKEKEKNNDNDLLCNFLCKQTRSIAMQDLCGRTAPVKDWYTKVTRPKYFICAHCLLPCTDCFLLPMPMKCFLKTNGNIQWIVSSEPHFGSVGCMLQHALHTKHSFAFEALDVRTSFLTDVYGMKPSDLLQLPHPPVRSDLPWFRSDFDPKSIPKKGFEFSSDFHQPYGVPSHGPNKEKHEIETEHAALLIDAFRMPQQLNLKVGELKAWFPRFYYEPMKSGVLKTKKSSDSVPKTPTLDDAFQKAKSIHVKKMELS